jgi:hypothetical protein
VFYGPVSLRKWTAASKCHIFLLLLLYANSLAHTGFVQVMRPMWGQNSRQLGLSAVEDLSLCLLCCWKCQLYHISHPLGLLAAPWSSFKLGIPPSASPARPNISSPSHRQIRRYLNQGLFEYLLSLPWPR